MSEFRPAVTKMRGRSNVQYRSFELIFDTFRVEIIELGHEPDQIFLERKNVTGHEEINYLLEAAAAKMGKKAQPSLIHNYADLDVFLCANHGAIEQLFVEAGFSPEQVAVSTYSRT